MKTATLLLLLVVTTGLASADFTAQSTHIDPASIVAEYLLEPGSINYELSDLRTPYNSLRLTTHSVTTDSAQRIIEETLGLPAGSYSYLLTASDSEDNSAAHDLYLTTHPEDPAIILVEPRTGIAGYPRAGLRFNTTTPATCEWSYHTPTGSNPPRPTTGDGTTAHTIPALETLYLPEGEVIPLILSCNGQETVIPYGWDRHEYAAHAEYHPMTAENDLDRLLVKAAIDNEGLSRCNLNGGSEDEESGPLKEHTFGFVPAGVNDDGYSITCEDPRGNVLPTAWLPRPAYSAAPLIIEPLRPLTPQSTPEVTLAVLTHRPAHCTATHAGTTVPLGPLRDGHEHQGQLTLSAGTTNTVSIACTADGTTLTAATELAIAVDTDAPTVTIAEGTYCTATGIAVLGGIDAQDATHLLISGPAQTMIRENQQTIILQGIAEAGAPISVRGVDAAGNLGEPLTRPLNTDARAECGYEDIENVITITSPENGATQDPEFALVVDSLLDSACTFTVDDATSTFSVTGGAEHIEAGFQDHLPGPGEHPITITCTNGTSTATLEDTVAWQTTLPTIALAADPEPVLDVTSQTTTLTITSDQHVVCEVTTDEGFFSETTYYRDTHEFPVAVPYGSVQVEASANCTNRGGLSSVASTTIREDYPSLLEIVDVDAPTLTNEEDIDLRITTNRPGICAATADSASATLPTTPDITHDGTIHLENGDHTLAITCQEEGDATRTAETTFRIAVDTRAPNVSITTRGYTCGLDELTVRADITDANGIESYNAWFNNKSYTSKRIPFTIDDLDLEENASYILTLMATDAAGNPSGNATQKIVGRTEEDGACDFTPPYAYLKDKERNDGVEVWLVCYDDDGCADDHQIGFGAWDGACKPEGASFSDNKTYTLNETTKVCWRVEDVNGNAFNDDKVILVTDRPDHCFDGTASGDETGLDCGGSCAPCETGPCVSDSDCGSGVCEQGVCAAGSCENGIKDSDETDVDCGGGTCGECDAGQQCDYSVDCASGVCGGGTCSSATCDDGVKNGGETDVDCGGSSCNECTEGDDCIRDSDCSTGICSGYICSTQRLETNNPSNEWEDDWDLGDTTSEEEGGMLGLLLIIFGVLLAGGGGGYIWYEQQQGAGDGGAAAARPASTAIGPDYSSSAITEEADDYASSELREKARKKRRTERTQDRKDLLSAFKEKATAKKEKPTPPEDAVSQENEKVHKQLAKAETPEAIKDLAASLLKKGEAGKHELSSALADLRAHDKLDEDALESLRKDLEL